MAIICRLREYNVERHPGLKPLIKNLFLIGAISLLILSVFLGVSFIAGGQGKTVEGRDGPARAAVTKEGDASRPER